MPRLRQLNTASDPCEDSGTTSFWRAPNDFEERISGSEEDDSHSDSMMSSSEQHDDDVISTGLSSLKHLIAYKLRKHRISRSASLEDKEDRLSDSGDSETDEDRDNSDEEYPEHDDRHELVEQDPSVPIENNSRINVEPAEDFCTPHTVNSIHEVVRKMKEVGPRDAFPMAAKLLNTQGSLRWAAENTAYHKEGDFKDRIESEHTLDFTSIDAMPSTSLAGDERGNITNGKLTLVQWSKPYASYRAYTADRRYFCRTLRIGEIAGSELFIVMVPKQGASILDIDLKTISFSKSLKRSAMSLSHATQLGTYIVQNMMSTRKLSRHGVTIEWKPGGVESADMDGTDWKLLFSRMIEGWEGFREACPEEYWSQQELSFHMYQIGQDVGIRPRQCRDGSLATTLSRMYDPGSVSTMMYALATNINISTCIPPSEPEDEDEERFEPYYEAKASLFDTAEITRDYLNVQDSGLRVFPMAFSPSVCSFQAKKAPQSYQAAVIEPLNQKLKQQNDIGNNQFKPGTDSDIVKVSLFQGYSLLKQYCRYRPSSFLLSQGTYTCVLCSPPGLNKLHTDMKTKMFRGIEAGTPFTKFEDGIDQACANGRLGSRIEPVISINFQALKLENRNWEYVCREIILPTMTWTKNARALYERWLCIYEPEIFPGILRDFTFIFRTALDELTRAWKNNGKESGLVASEAICTIERLSAMMFTGNNAHIPTRVWNYIGLKPSLTNYGWPYIMPGRVDLSAIPGPRTASDWSLQVGGKGPLLSHLTTIRFHYGEAAFVQRAAAMTLLISGEVATTAGAIEKFRELIKKFMVPQLKELTLKSLREQHSSISSISAAVASGSRDEDDPKRVEQEVKIREALIKGFITASYPFSRELMLKLIDRFFQRSPEQPWVQDNLPFPAAEIDLIQPNEMAMLILSWNTVSPTPISSNSRLSRCGAKSFCKKEMSWLDTFFQIMGRGDTLTKKEWLEALRWAFKWECIEIIPGPYNGLLSGRRFTKIQEFTGFTHKRLLANNDEIPSSAEAIQGAVKRLRTVAPLPLSIPIISLPSDFESGMNAFITRYETSDRDPSGATGPSIAAFLRRAATAIDLNNAAHNLFLLIGYVLSRVTPPPMATAYTKLHPQRFLLVDGRKTNTPKDEWYFVFVVRCLMWSNPEVTLESPGLALASVIIKIIEHKKINNRLLEGLKVCVRIGSVRPWPHSSDMQINTDEDFRVMLAEAVAASEISAKSVFQIWLPEDMANRAVGLIPNEHDTE